jgi:XRE family aerobic/anaerobic benzoate catabolism transcriptional regulator
MDRRSSDPASREGPHPDAANEPAWKVALGLRTRALRDRAGLTRKELATASGLSLRFLSDVEAGKANPSLGSLHDLARALEVDVTALLLPEPAPRTVKPLALLGLRGAGKSTIGARLGKALGWTFVELDRRIEREAGLRLGPLFELHGEAHYRALERRVLGALLDEGTPAVIATGGGIVAHPESFELLRGKTTTIWLKATPDDHWDRVVGQGDRRPVEGRERARAELDALYWARASHYERADLTVDTSARSPEAVCAEIQRALSG